MAEEVRDFESGGVIDIWPLSLDRALPDMAREASLLSGEEQRRAAALVNPRDTQRFVLRRKLLRAVLARYTQGDPAAMEFVHGVDGKLRLMLAGTGANFSFNSSDKDDCFVVAVSRGVEIGVDIEVLRELDDSAATARRFFTPGEAAQILALPVAKRHAAFLTCWVRKEAVMKAHGGGMRLGLDNIEAGFSPIAAEGLTVEADGREFTIKDLILENGLVSAVAAKAPNFDIAYRAFD